MADLLLAFLLFMGKVDWESGSRVDPPANSAGEQVGISPSRDIVFIPPGSSVNNVMMFQAAKGFLRWWYQDSIRWFREIGDDFMAEIYEFWDFQLGP
jgi:hypothetical protein